jgi:hypothetical protein
VAQPITLIAAAISGVGAVVLALSGRGNLRDAARPRLNWRLRHTFSVMLLVAAVLSLGLTGYLMQLYSFFTVVQGLGAILGGAALVPILLACVPFARPAARMAVEVESRRLIAGGLAFMGCALMLTSLLRPGMPYWPLVIPMGVFGMGF